MPRSIVGAGVVGLGFVLLAASGIACGASQSPAAPVANQASGVIDQPRHIVIYLVADEAEAARVIQEMALERDLQGFNIWPASSVSVAVKRDGETQVRLVGGDLSELLSDSEVEIVDIRSAE